MRDGLTGALVLTARSRAGHSRKVRAVSFSANGSRLLNGSDDGTLTIRDFQQLLDSRDR